MSLQPRFPTGALLALLCAILTAGTAACAGRLQLPSDSADGAWRFYPAENPTPGLPRVLLVGDSIMNGYRGEVARRLAGRADVDCWLTPLALNSPALLPDLRQVLRQGPYAVVHFNIGLHEWQKGCIAPDQYEPLLRAYLQVYLDEARGARLVWASTTPISRQDDLAALDPENNPTIVTRNAIAAKVMREKGVAVDDLYALLAGRLSLKSDYLHWNDAARVLQAEAVVEAILPGLAAPPRP